MSMKKVPCADVDENASVSEIDQESSDAQPSVADSRQAKSTVRVMSGIDAEQPDEVPRPSKVDVQRGTKFVGSLPASSRECAQLRKVNYAKKVTLSKVMQMQRVQLDSATSTWLSVTAKGIRLGEFVDFESQVPASLLKHRPHCPQVRLLKESA